MTKSQEKVIKEVKKAVNEQLLHNEDPNYEIKKWEEKEYKYFVSLYVVTGMKDDDGTMASVLCRDRVHLFIGKKGGVRYPVSKKSKNGEWKQITRTLTYYNLCAVNYAQKYNA